MGNVAADSNGPAPSSRRGIAGGSGWFLLVLGGVLLMGPQTRALAQACFTWVDRTTAGPSARGEHAMAYDSARGVAVLFGGLGGFVFSNGDTWEWDGTSWTLSLSSDPNDPNRPSPRYAHTMAYDSARGVTVLFGGLGADPLPYGDTWEWDGTSWALKLSSDPNDPNRPSPRVDHAMAYDSARGMTVLFGGVYWEDANWHHCGDTWEWDGTSWALRSSTGPSARYGHAMAYDSARGVTVLFGGSDSAGRDGETWEWDGTSWTLRSSSGPSPRYYHAMAYDSARGVTVLFGGSDSAGRDGETWEWDGTSWTFRGCISPSPRTNHAMAYDSARDVTVLSGKSASGGLEVDTWEGTPGLGQLALTLKDAGPSWVDIEPNDPNWAPFIYPCGTALTLTAVPAHNKVLSEWNLWDLNHPNDANYIVTDANNPIVLVMDVDRKVDAVFRYNCGLFGPVIYVDASASGLNDGTNWPNAFTDLDVALAAAADCAAPGRQIWVAEGVYKPTEDANDPAATFQLVNGVAVFGGFPTGGGDGTFGARNPDPNTNHTVLSGDIDNNDPNDNGVSTQVLGENSTSVVASEHTILDPNTMLDGLTITGGAGRGIINAGDPTVANCIFSGNRGSGMDNSGGAPTLANCAFNGNGGGMDNDSGSATLTCCTFRDNWDSGMDNSYSTATLTNCTFSGNSALCGGGMFNNSSDVTLTNCTFTGNLAFFDEGVFDGLGGGICQVLGSSLTATNCTFSGNCAEQYGGGIAYVFSPGQYATLANCILWGNSDSTGTGETAQIFTDSHHATVSYSCIQGCATYCADANNHNIGGDPLFVDPNGPDGDPNTWQDNDYHLWPNSPCINAGDPNGDYTNQTDMDGEPRVMLGRVDMGSDEYAGCLLEIGWIAAGGSVSVDPCMPVYGYYRGTEVTLEAFPSGGHSFHCWRFFDPNHSGDVNYAVDDANNPTTIVMDTHKEVWAVWDLVHNITQDTYHGSIQLAINSASNGDEIVLSPVTFTGDGNRDLDFGGTNMTVRSTDPNDPNVVAATVIDCQGDPNYPDDPNYHHRGFYFHSDEDANAVVAGLTITNGFVSGANQYDPNGWGGGMYTRDSSPTVTHCTFSGNRAYSGAGICCDGNGTTVTDCTFTGNTAAFGGGIYCDSSCTITHCTVIGNTGDLGGGGIACADGAPTIRNCTISGNSTTFVAGGGGGIGCSYGTCTISNCTITGNSAAGWGGGGVGFTYDGEGALTNCAVWGNTASNGPQIALVGYYGEYPTATVAYCDVQGGQEAVYVDSGSTLNWGDGNIDADPLFVDPNGPDGDPNTCDDNDFHLSSGSPCIDAGDPNTDPNGQTDIDGEPRLMGEHVDMGSDECPGAPYAYKLTLTLKDPGPSTVEIDPNDPNWIPYVYPTGTALTLTAVPGGSKTFNKWKIWDPNDANDFVIDTNNPLHLTMDADYKVKAFFKCGGGGVEEALPLLGAFGVLGLFALARRRR